METKTLKERKADLVIDIHEKTPVSIVAQAYFETVGFGYLFEQINAYIDNSNSEQLARLEHALQTVKAYKGYMIRKEEE